MFISHKKHKKSAYFWPLEDENVIDWISRGVEKKKKQKVDRFLYTINTADQILSVKITHQTLIKIYILGLKDVSTISKAWNNLEYIL